MDELMEAFEAKLGKKYKKKQVFGNLPHRGAISTGIIELDIATGIGGYPKGRYVEIFGKESSGKSLISIVGMATAQKLLPNKYVAYFDLEHGTPEDWLTTHGVDMGRCKIPPDIECGEEALSLALDMVKSNLFSLIIIDSVPGLVPRKVLEDTIDQKDRPGEDARMITKGIRKLIAGLEKTETSLIFINQTRKAIGIMYGPNDVTPGGNAIRFYASQRWSVSRKSGEGTTFMDKKEVLGHTIQVKIIKNKLAPPLRSGEFDLYYASGVNNARLLLKWGKAIGMLARGGIGGIKLADHTFKDKAEFFTAVSEDFDLERKIHDRILEEVLSKRVAIAVETSEADELEKEDEMPEDAINGFETEEDS